MSASTAKTLRPGSSLSKGLNVDLHVVLDPHDAVSVIKDYEASRPTLLFLTDVFHHE